MQSIANMSMMNGGGVGGKITTVIGLGFVAAGVKNVAEVIYRRFFFKSTKDTLGERNIEEMTNAGGIIFGIVFAVITLLIGIPMTVAGVSYWSS